MLGRAELEKLQVQKQALVLESSLNRLALQAEFEHLRSATTWMRTATSSAGKVTPLLLLLAPLAGFLLARGASRPSGSWLSRAVSALRWVASLYGLWQQFSPGRRKLEEPPSA